MRKLILVVAALAACGTAFAAGAVKTDVWHKAAGTTTPNFAVDPSWPQPLPLSLARAECGIFWRALRG